MDKQWIKVNRGLIRDPKHRRNMGMAIWLYEYMLDIVNWNTAKIAEWTDGAAGEEIEMNSRTVRKYRQILEEHGYIKTQKHMHYLSITIMKFKNPRTKRPVETDTDMSVKTDTDMSVSMPQSDTESDTESDTNMSHFLFNSHNHINTSDLTSMYQSMMDFFIDECKFKSPRIPSMNHQKNWVDPIDEILTMAEFNLDKSISWCREAIKIFDKNKLLASTPSSLLKTIQGFYSREQRQSEPVGVEFKAEDIL